MTYKELMGLMRKAVVQMEEDSMTPESVIINENLKEVCQKEFEEIKNVPFDAFETVFGIPVSFAPLSENVYFVVMQDEPWSKEDAFKMDRLKTPPRGLDEDNNSSPGKHWRYIESVAGCVVTPRKLGTGNQEDKA